MSSTSRGVSVVTLGQTLALSSLFSAALQAGTSAAVSIVPAGYAAVTPSASVSGATVSYSMSAAYDVVHTGTVTLTYGAAQRAYSWSAGTLTSAHIYTFPSAFTYTGELTDGAASSLVLTFAGGDMLHSSVVAAQVSYVRYAQGTGGETTVALASLSCSDPLETIGMPAITPAGTAQVTIKVKLVGPDGVLGSEIVTVVPITPKPIAPGELWAQQASTWQQPANGFFSPGSSPSNLSYSSDLTTLSVASPACNYYGSVGHVVMFADLPNHAFAGDFSLVVKFTNNIFFMLVVIAGPSISPSSIVDYSVKSTSTNSAYPFEPYSGAKPGFAKASSAGTFVKHAAPSTYGNRVGYWNQGQQAILGTFYMRIRRIGTSLSAHVSGDNVTYYSSPVGTSFFTVCGNVDPGGPFAGVTIPAADKVMICIAPYDIMGHPQATARSMQLTCPFSYPNAASFSPNSATRGAATAVSLTMSGFDTVLSSTCAVYTLLSGAYTLVGTGKLLATGVATAECVFPTEGSFSLAFVVTAGSGRSTAYVTCSGGTITVDPAPSIVSSGLVIDVSASTYVSGSTMPNAASGGAVATLKGTYNSVTVASKSGIHLVNTSSTCEINVSGMLLPQVAYRTISMWIRFPTTNPADGMAYLLDGRIAPAGWGVLNQNYTYFNPPQQQYGPPYGTTFYLNGGAAQNITTNFLAKVQNVLNTWHHVTVVLTSTISDARWAVGTYFDGTIGSNVIVGRVTVYSTALSQADNAQNYNASF